MIINKDVFIGEPWNINRLFLRKSLLYYVANLCNSSLRYIFEVLLKLGVDPNQIVKKIFKKSVVSNSVNKLAFSNCKYITLQVLLIDKLNIKIEF